MCARHANSGREEVWAVTEQVPDELLDTYDRIQRRMRPLISRPPVGQVPMPSLGRPLDVSKLIALDVLLELTAVGPVSVKDLAEHLGLEHSTVSRLLTELEDEGLVVRSTDPDDKRRRTVVLTELGAAVAAESKHLARLFAHQLFLDWDPDELRQFLSMLDRLVETAHSRLAGLKDMAPWHGAE